ncbi:hypothetical protein CEXT_698701 [Caerostris extrusa]|uniref:Uncharacterized protein n=1 Tax=Caerostris extrusa TaxID=172846 RepID=A0AAV4MPN1_CAEEX|nr:hypothetical protein CEXT_698701 [Caerostris extrusa]
MLVFLQNILNDAESAAELHTLKCRKEETATNTIKPAITIRWARLAQDSLDEIRSEIGARFARDSLDEIRPDSLDEIRSRFVGRDSLDSWGEIHSEIRSRFIDDIRSSSLDEISSRFIGRDSLRIRWTRFVEIRSKFVGPDSLGDPLDEIRSARNTPQRKQVGNRCRLSTDLPGIAWGDSFLFVENLQNSFY